MLEKAFLGWFGSVLDQLDDVNWPLMLLAVMAVAQFLYFDVCVQIGALPRIIVFVLVGGEPST